MTRVLAKAAGFTGFLTFLLLLSEPANALRCGSKLVREGMIESEVIRICGEPVATRHLGYVLRSGFRSRRLLDSGSLGRYHYGYGFHEELVITEMLFNFGPRKLMRTIRFEGGRVARIETAGYGYLETNR